MGRRRKTLDTSLLYSKLKYKYLLAERSLNEAQPKAIEFFKAKGLAPGKIREHAARLLTSGALASSLLLLSPKIATLPTPASVVSELNTVENLQNSLIQKLASILPLKIKSLTHDQEIQISHLLYNTFGINAVPKLGSTKLNHVYGYIGAEQHLPRFPGDTIAQHGEYQKAGITPGLGAWGYFAPSRQALTEDLVMKEKYYVVVQTLYLPDWLSRFKFLRDWYKYRKVVVVNPVNGKTIVCVVADSGPSWWTGKQFGGSPEVMAYLGLNVGKQKGPVVLYFVDDSEDSVPLGPLEYNLAERPQFVAKK